MHGNADAISRIPCKQCGRQKEFSKEFISHTVGKLRVDGKDIDVISAQEQDTDVLEVKSLLKMSKVLIRIVYLLTVICLEFHLKQWQRLKVMDNIVVRRLNVLGSKMTFWQAIIPLKINQWSLK